jgi:hypothetical protein
MAAPVTVERAAHRRLVGIVSMLQLDVLRDRGAVARVWHPMLQSAQIAMPNLTRNWQA